MEKLKKCPVCGSIELIMLNESEQQYKCHACLKTFNLKEKSTGSTETVTTLSTSKRKNFFDKLINKTVELHVYFEKDVVAGIGKYIIL